MVFAPVPARIDLLESALDGGRIDLGKSILEGGRALEIARARLCGGTEDPPFVLSVRVGFVVLAWDRDRVGASFGTPNSFLERSVTEGGLEGTLELDWEDTVGGNFVATRPFGLSGAEVACTGTLGFGGGISWRAGAGTIVILLGPVCILGTSPGTVTDPGCTRVTPPLLGADWLMTRLGPGRAVTSTRAWDIVLIFVDVVESVFPVML